MKSAEQVLSNKNRVFYFDLLKVIACIAVITIHTPGSTSWSNFSSCSFDFISSAFYVSISRWSVPVFFMISGALLLGNSNRLNIKKLYKSILRFFTATVFWSIVYASFDLFSGKGVKTSIDTLIGGEYHMWFMFAIIALYMLAPILNSFVQDEKILKYSLAIFFIFPFLLGVVSVLLSFDVPHTQFFILQFKGALNKFGFISTVEPMFYFLLGYYLHNRSLSKKTEKIFIISGIVSLALTFIFTVIVSVRSGSTNETFHDSTTLNVFLSSVGIFIASKKYVVQEKIPTLIQKFIIFTSKQSFGIYLSHALVLSLFETAGITPKLFPAVFSIPFVVITVFIFSILLTFILSKIPLLKKWII